MFPGLQSDADADTNSDSEVETEEEEETETTEERPNSFHPHVTSLLTLDSYVEKEIETRIRKWKLELEQKEMETQPEQTGMKKKINAIWQRENPVKEYYRHLIRNAPPTSQAALIKKQFPGWTEAQLINFLYSQGNINHSLDNPRFICLEQSGSIPKVFYNQFEHLRINPPAIEQPAIDWENEAADVKINLPNPPRVRNQIRVDLTKVRPEVQFGSYNSASTTPNLNPDEEALKKNSISRQLATIHNFSKNKDDQPGTTKPESKYISKRSNYVKNKTSTSVSV